MPQANIRLEKLLYQAYLQRHYKSKADYIAHEDFLIHEKYFNILRSRGINAVLSGECPARIMNCDYGQTAIDHLAKIAWGRVLQTDNYGKPVKQHQINEFSDSGLLKKIGDILDSKLLEYYKNSGIFRDELENIIGTALNKWKIN